MLIERGVVFGFEPAIRGMRNPRRSWHLIDSFVSSPDVPTLTEAGVAFPERYFMGDNDRKRTTGLIRGGSPHCKFLRMIQIWVDLVLPIYVWYDLDTYKVATVKNCESSRNTPKKRPFEKSDFERPISDADLAKINMYRSRWLAEPTEETLLEMKGNIPMSFLQRATYNFNYETALAILRQRSNHPFPEFNVNNSGSLCSWILHLPYMMLFHGADLERGKSFQAG